MIALARYEPKVRLTKSAAFMAAQVGVMRRVSNRCKGLAGRYGADESISWNEDCEAGGGEKAVASYFGLYHDGSLGNFKAADVGELQVRTRLKDWYDLIVHPEDKEEDIFILVTGLLPNYVLRGWLYGYEARQEEYWDDPAGGRPAFFVPQADLRDIRSLEPIICRMFCALSERRQEGWWEEEVEAEGEELVVEVG